MPIMEGESKTELIPSGCKTEEFSRFEQLAKQLVNVPKKDIKDREKIKDNKKDRKRA